jgi:hypothetical protein
MQQWEITTMPRIEEFFLRADGDDWLPAVTRAQREFPCADDQRHPPGSPWSSAHLSTSSQTPFD